MESSPSKPAQLLYNYWSISTTSDVTEAVSLTTHSSLSCYCPSSLTAQKPGLLVNYHSSLDVLCLQTYSIVLLLLCILASGTVLNPLYSAGDQRRWQEISMTPSTSSSWTLQKWTNYGSECSIRVTAEIERREKRNDKNFGFLWARIWFASANLRASMWTSTNRWVGEATQLQINLYPPGLGSCAVKLLFIAFLTDCSSWSLGASCELQRLFGSGVFNGVHHSGKHLGWISF